ncbi:hypothetical protein [uncultured Sphingomonas sp.]|nr:hypothetical protein [uncultured Sphingomonas sp.]
MADRFSVAVARLILPLLNHAREDVVNLALAQARILRGLRQPLLRFGGVD